MSRLHIQMITAIMRGPMSRNTLRRDTGAHPKTVAAFIRDLRDLGVIYRTEFRVEGGARRPSEFFAMQTKPFELPDAEKVV